MKFVLILALLCASYAEEHATTTAPLSGERLPPKHIMDFVEQHIKHVKQQIPIIQQQIKEGKVQVEIVKPAVNDKQVPDNIKQFITSHINQVLQHVAQQKQEKQLHVPLVGTQDVGVPQFVVEKIKKLQDHVKNIMQQVETHIPQVINQQIAYKQKIKNKEKVPEVIIENVNQQVPQAEKHKMKTRSIKEDAKLVEKPNEHKDVVDIKPIIVPSLVEEIVQQVHQHVPQVVSQHVENKPNVIPPKVQGIVEQIHHHVPQVLNHHVENKPSVIPPKVQGIVEQIHHHVPQVVSHQVAQVQQQVPHVTAHQVETRSTKEEKEVIDNKPVKIPSLIQHVPSVISHHVAHGQIKNVNKNQLVVPAHVQGIVEQVHHHIPQVVNHLQKGTVHEKVPLPLHILDIVQQVHQHVPQIIDQHIGQGEKKVIASTVQPFTQTIHTHVVMKPNPKSPTDIHSLVTKIQKHVSQNAHHVDKQNSELPVKPSNVQEIQTEVQIPPKVQHIVNQVTQHIPQVINQQIDAGNKDEKA